MYDCLLDRLHAHGFLGADGRHSRAQQRLDIGMWLRELFLERARLGHRVSGHYGDPSAEEDCVQASRLLFRRVMRQSGKHAGLLVSVCCLDSDIKASQIRPLLEALDALLLLRTE